MNSANMFYDNQVNTPIFLAENLHSITSCMIAEAESAALEPVHLYSPSSSSSRLSKLSVVPELVSV